MKLFTLAVHRLIKTLLPPPVPPHLPYVVASCHHPARRARLWVGDSSLLLMTQTYHRRGSGVGCGYLSPESILCHACGGA